MPRAFRCTADGCGTSIDWLRFGEGQAAVESRFRDILAHQYPGFDFRVSVTPAETPAPTIRR